MFGFGSKPKKKVTRKTAKKKRVEVSWHSNWAIKELGGLAKFRQRYTERGEVLVRKRGGYAVMH